MEWSNEKVISLIDRYRNRPVLWNYKLKEYKDRNKRYEALVEIAMSFGIPIEEVERKLKNLICHFSREVKREREGVKSGNGIEEVYKSKWFAYQSMEFLKDRNRLRGMTDTQESDASSQHSQSTTSADYSNRMSPPPTTSTTQPESSQSDTSKKYSSRPRRRKEKQDETDGAPEVPYSLEKEPSGINNPNEDNDEFHFFGLNVASQLRKLPLYEALGVEAEIQNVLSSARRRNIYPQVSTLTGSTLPASNTETNTLPAPQIQPITYSTLATSNTQTNTLPALNNEPIAYSALPASNTQTNPPLAPHIQPMTYSTHSTTNTLSYPNSSIFFEDENEEDGREMEDVGQQEFDFAIKTEIEDNPVLNEDVKPPDGMNTSTPPAKRRRISAGNALNDEVVNQLEEEEMDRLKSFQQQDPKYDDLLFFKTLLPFVGKIDPLLKLRFRIRINEVVEEFAYGDSRHAVQSSLGTSFSSDRRPPSRNSYVQLPPENS